MKLRRIYQLPYLCILIWPVVYTVGLFFLIPHRMLVGMWEGFIKGGERVKYFLYEYRFRPWVALPKVWDGYKITLARKHKLFPNGIDHMRRRVESK